MFLLLYLFLFFYQYVKDRVFLYRANVIRPYRNPVENNGFEPLTLCVQGRCSSQLS